MNLVVLRTVARMMAPVLFLFSLALAVRGHDKPGGGFVGGLMAASAFTLLLVAYGVEQVRRRLPIGPMRLTAVGHLTVLASGLPALFQGRPFLTGLWVKVPLPWGGEVDLGTPLLFDAGVYLLVLGATLAFVLGLAREEAQEPAGQEEMR